MSKLEDDIFQISLCKTHDDAIKTVKKLGFKILGNGHFSAVYGSKGKEYVVKVSLEEDLAYLKYVNFITKNPNIHFPIVTLIKQTTFNERTLCIYLLEKLNPLAKTPQNTILMYLINHLSMVNLDFKSHLQVNKSHKLYYEKNKSFFKALKMVKNFHRGGDLGLDIKRDNLMQRIDGTVVITDPVYDLYDQFY